MRKYIAVVMSLTMMTGLFGLQCQALEADDDIIRVGYMPNYGTLLEPQNIDFMGYGYEYLDKIADYTGWNYEYVKCGWTEGMELLEKGEIDLFGPMQKTAERAEQYLFPQQEMGYEYAVLYAHENSDIYYNDLEFFDGMRVGTEKNNFYTQRMEEFCADEGISVTFVYTQGDNIALELAENKYDTFISGSLYDVKDMKIVEKISVEPYYYVMNKDKTGMMASLNHALQEIAVEDAYFAANLEDKYFSVKQMSSPAFTKKEVEIIRRFPTLKVACETDWAPMQYIDKKTGVLCGISIDMIKKVGEIAGIEMEFVPTTPGEDKSRLLDSGQVDLVASYSHDIRTDLWYSDGYLHMPMVLASKRGVNLNEKLDVAVLPINWNVRQQLSTDFPQFTTKDYSNLGEIIQGIKDGTNDLGLVSTYAYDELMRQSDNTSYVALPTNLTVGLDIGVSRKLPIEVKRVIDSAIKRIDPAFVSGTVFANTAGRAYTSSLRKVIRENRGIVTTIVMVLATGFLAVIFHNNNKLKTFAFVDDITGVSSFAKFRQDAKALLKTAKSGDYMIVSLDIDNFRYINDVFGYETGNRILGEIAKEFSRHKTPETILARQVADTFIFIKSNDGILEGWDNRQNAINHLVCNILGVNYNLVFSVGTYEISDPNKDINAMIDCANIARKMVKGQYGHSVGAYTEDLNSLMSIQRDITLNMTDALFTGQFVPYLQPKYALHNDKIMGAEALVRWIRPDGTIIYPDLFIPLFERNGFIKKLDFYMMDATCRLISDWKKAGETTIPCISVNLSKNSLGSEDIVEELVEIVHSYGLETKELEIELTESTMTEDTARMFEVMEQFMAAGFYLSIDDFGSGYSSLNMLKDIPANILKIDKGFLSEVHTTDKGRTILNNIITMAKEINLVTLAEGVETKEQLETLRNMGCDLVQGYYFARPMPKEQFLQLYQEQQRQSAAKEAIE